MPKGQKKTKQNQQPRKKKQPPKKTCVTSAAASPPRQSSTLPVTRFMGRSGSRASLRFSHSELITSIPTSPVTLTFLINPARRAVFPWLSSLAPSFESYRFTSLRFRYYPVLTQLGTNGQIVMAIDYDPLDTDTPGFEKLLTNQGAVGSYIVNNVTLNTDMSLVRRNAARDTFFTEVDGAGPSRTSDICRLMVVTHGVSTTTTTPVAGYIMCDYDVELICPQAIRLEVAPTLSISKTSVAGDPLTPQHVLGTVQNVTQLARESFKAVELVGTAIGQMRTSTSSSYSFASFAAQHPRMKFYVSGSPVATIDTQSTLPNAAGIIFDDTDCSYWQLTLQARGVCDRGVSNADVPAFRIACTEGLTITTSPTRDPTTPGSVGSSLFGDSANLIAALTAGAPGGFIGVTTVVTISCSPGSQGPYHQAVVFDLLSDYWTFSSISDFWCTLATFPMSDDFIRVGVEDYFA